ncbi:hypothetical protein HC761_01825 [bacterium]|nr:hypothetical protein [bacterium]
MAPALRSKCPIRLAFIDRRTDVDNLGVIGNRAVVYPDFSAWFSRQLRTHLRAEESTLDSPKLLVELTQAYMETNRSTLSFNIVAKVSEQEINGAPIRVYRGATTKMNWFGGDGETGAYVERATKDLLAKLSAAEDKLVALLRAIDFALLR